MSWHVTYSCKLRLCIDDPSNIVTIKSYTRRIWFWTWLPCQPFWNWEYCPLLGHLWVYHAMMYVICHMHNYMLLEIHFLPCYVFIRPPVYLHLLISVMSGCLKLKHLYGDVPQTTIVFDPVVNMPDIAYIPLTVLQKVCKIGRKINMWFVLFMYSKLRL